MLSQSVVKLFITTCTQVSLQIQATIGGLGQRVPTLESYYLRWIATPTKKIWSVLYESMHSNLGGTKMLSQGN